MSLVLSTAMALGVLLLGTASDPSAAEAPARPFGSHLVPYEGDSALPSDLSGRDAATSHFYDRWRARYLRAGCGKGRYFVDTRAAAKARVVSEGQGYGMEIVPLMAGHDSDAQAVFDGLFRYVEDHPSDLSPHLMAWQQDHSCRSIGGVDSATDGDLSIAFGLLLADRQWGSDGAIDYFAEAERRIAAIKKWEVNPQTQLTNLGDWARHSPRKYRFGTRTSDFMLDHFRAFQTATGDSFWGEVVSATEDLIAEMQSRYAPRTGLLPDFVVNTDRAPRPAVAHYLESRYDGAYSWNACRVPWHLGTDFLISGDEQSQAATITISRWAAKKLDGKPGAIRSGYSLDGHVLPDSWYEMAFAAPLAVGAGTDGARTAWADDLWTNIAGESAKSGGYYGATLKLQAMLVLSNNYWLP